MISQIKQKGFTIVELLIVIVVIGILAAISIVAYNNVTQKARDDQRITDARNIINAAASYHAEEGTWPDVVALRGYNTVKLSGTALERLKTTQTASNVVPVVGTKDSHYRYSLCGTTGALVEYWKEALATGETSPMRVTAGTGC